MMFQVGQLVHFAGLQSKIVGVESRLGNDVYQIENGPLQIPMWVPDRVLARHQQIDNPETVFNAQTPEVLVVDDFLKNPDEVREIALSQTYVARPEYFKGLRTDERFLWPNLREEFSRLLGLEVTDWLKHEANGVFQQTMMGDSLVWHSDRQDYAAAIYLNPDGPPSGGTSFWRDKRWGCRRFPDQAKEIQRIADPAVLAEANTKMREPENLSSPENWELIESVAGLYNRLVIWDAKLVHSATSYEGFTAADQPGSQRLVQLFFFGVS
ncbi:MAG: DUF6445 family protein [Actinomycetes bacterium]